MLSHKYTQIKADWEMGQETQWNNWQMVCHGWGITNQLLREP